MNDPVILDAGRVGKPHGLDGSFYVTRPDTALLAADELLLDGAPIRVLRRAGTAECPILRIDGVGDRAAAQTLRGAQLSVALARAPQLAPDEYWAHELQGCAVADGARRVGEVVRMFALPSCEALEVRRDGAPPLIVPMVKDAIRSVDIAARRIDIDLEFLGEAA